jgi:ribonuclease Z
MKIVFLGTGGGFPSKERGVSAVAVRVNGGVALFDCGEGTQRQLMFSPFSYMKIRRIFITHFHGDHFLGTAGLVQSMCLNNRTEPLEIYGPVRTIEFMKAFMKIGYFNQTMPVLYHDLTGGELLEFDHYSVRSLAVDHEIPALAFSLEESERAGLFNPKKAKSLGVKEGPDFRKLQNGKTISVGDEKVRPDMVMGKPRKGRKMVYTGDTRPTDELAPFVAGADVLIHDSTFHSNMAERGLEFGHSTSKHAAELAVEGKVKKLFLTHISNRYSTDPTPLLDEAMEIFPNTEMASDLLEYEVPRKK